MIGRTAAALVGAWLTGMSASAHEFWVEGRAEASAQGPVLALDLKVGQRLRGTSLPYVPDHIAAFEWVAGGQGKIQGALGDVPAARVPWTREVGAVLFHRTEPRVLEHKDWALFLAYLADEGAEEIEAAHLDRGLPETGFVESYTRHAKLVVPGEGTLADRYLGSPAEIVLTSLTKTDAGWHLSGRFHGAMAGRVQQINVFQGAEEDVTVWQVVTDAKGAFEVKLESGAPVLLNAVQITPGKESGVAWHSDWASVYLVLE